MAKLINASSSSSVNVSGRRTVDTSWKATAYLNLYLPGRIQLGGIPLAGNNADHQSLVQELLADSKYLERVKRNLTMDFSPLKTAEVGYANLAAYMPAVVEDSEPGKAYLNFYLPGADGNPNKLGFIELNPLVRKDAGFINWLTAVPGDISKLLADITVTFTLIAPKTGSGYKLA